jgi:hypothetical protein
MRVYHHHAQQCRMETASQRFRLWKGQKFILREFTYPQHVLAPGVGYGKTTFGARWLHVRILENEKPFKYAILAPTHKLLKECFDIFEQHLIDIGWVENIHYQIKRSAGSLEIRYPNGARVFGVSAQNYKTIVSYTFACAWLDEPGFLDDHVYPELLKRVRQGGAKVVQVLRTGVPQGRGDSEYFRKCVGPQFTEHLDYTLPGEGTFTRYRQDGVRLIMHGSTHENAINDSRYISNLKDDFGWSKSLWEQQVHGLFIGASVNCLYDFDRNTHAGIYPSMPAVFKRWLSWDFNVGQVSWVCAEPGPLQGGRESYHVVAENCTARDTVEGCRKFIQAFPPEIYGRHSLIITGDCNGWSRDTRNYSNDYEIIRETLQPYYPNLQIVTPRTNPDVSLSIIATNRLFNENPLTGDKIRLFINHRCSKLIASLLSTEPDGRGGIKKPTGETWTHPADALRYLVHLVAPLHRAQVTGGAL